MCMHVPMTVSLFSLFSPSLGFMFVSVHLGVSHADCLKTVPHTDFSQYCPSLFFRFCGLSVKFKRVIAILATLSKFYTTFHLELFKIHSSSTLSVATKIR